MNTPAQTPESAAEPAPETEPQSTPQPAAETVEERKHMVAGTDGLAYKFTDEEIQYLATKGLALEMGGPQTPSSSDPPPSNQPVKKDEPTPADIMARLDKMEKTSDDEKRQRDLAARRESVSKNLESELGKYDFLEDKDSLVEFARETVLQRFSMQPTKPLSKHVEEVMKHLSGGKAAATTNYAKQKQRDADNTRGVSATGGGEGPAPKSDTPFTKADMMAGKIRAKMVEALRKNKQAELTGQFQ